MEYLDAINEHLLRFSPDALIVVDDRGLICFANETVTSLLGYRPYDLIGKPVSVLIPDRLRERHIEHVDRYVREPQSRDMGAQVGDQFARRADGSEFAAAIRLAPIRIKSRSFVAAAIRDVTERREFNEALVAAREEADRANRAKSRFLATASHDLRQPMQTIRLLNMALQKMVPQPDVRELLQQQGQAIENMVRLLNALLDISRLESGAVRPNITDVPLAKVFEELRTEFASIARTRRIGLHFQATDLVVSTDRVLFYQLLQNLLGNALKYTDEGNVSVACTLTEDALTVSIEDSGVGIPKDKLERIFDEYYQVDTHGTKRMGVGLGLAIVKEVARLLGFSVRITSQLGEGTQARISIPSRQIVVRSATAHADSRVTGDADAHRPARLLLVEDNDGVRVATELFLKLEGYEVLSTCSAAEAQMLFSQLRPDDVVIVDYHLEDRHTGLDVLFALREQSGRNVPGIILSGDLQSVLRRVDPQPANCRFLSKPVDTAALLEAVRELSDARLQAS